MSIEPTAAAAAASTRTTKNALGTDYESFLKLLTAQISNQDPLSPMESTDFIAQLAQLSTVEQSVKTNERLGEIAGQLSSVTSMADIGLIGRKVSLASNRIALDDGLGRVSYELAETSDRVAIHILDLQNNVVQSLPGPLSPAGKGMQVDWDGRDAAGNIMPDGYFQIEINAESADGNTVAYNTFADVEVDSVSLDTDGTTLVLANGQTAKSGEILGVR